MILKISTKSREVHFWCKPCCVTKSKNRCKRCNFQKNNFCPRGNIVFSGRNHPKKSKNIDLAHFPAANGVFLLFEPWLEHRVLPDWVPRSRMVSKLNRPQSENPHHDSPTFRYVHALEPCRPVQPVEQTQHTRHL